MSDSISYYLRHPREQKFYKVIAILSTVVGMGDQTWWEYSPPRRMLRKAYMLQFVITHTVGVALVFLQLIYYYQNHKELSSDTKGIMYAVIPMSIFANINIYSAKLNSNVRVMKHFMRKYHLCNLDTPDRHIEQIQIKSEMIIRLSCYFTSFFTMSDWFSWSFNTVYNSYKHMDLIQNKSMHFQTVVYAWWPIDYRYDFKNWLVVHTFNIYAALIATVCMLLHGTMNYAFVIHLIGHIKILKHKLKTSFLGEFTDEQVKQKLIDVIQYHTFVLKDIQFGFGIFVTAVYVYNLLTDSLMLYQVMVGAKDNIMMFGMMIGTHFAGLSILSFLFEETQRQSVDIADLVYELPWEGMSLPNRRMLGVLLLRVQPRMVFRAAGGLECGVKPLLSILQSTFSYYVMLKSSNFY